jgi:hypothetical protein
MADTQLPAERRPDGPKPPSYPHPGGEPQQKSTIFRRWRKDAVFQWGFLFRLGAAAIVVIVPVSAILTALALTSSADSADRLAAAGDVLVGATLLLGLAAALVTLLAFMTTLGPPNLRLQLACEYSKPNNPVFQADRFKDGTFQARQGKQLSVRIAIWNDGLFTAKEPRVIVRLGAMACPAESDARIIEDWTVLDVVDAIGITAVEWEGGLGYSIHPNSVRRLPGFYVKDLQWKQEWGRPGFIVEILLDTMRQVYYIPVEFEVNGEFFAWEEDERGTVAPWLPPPPENGKPGPHGSRVYTGLPDHQQERQAAGGSGAPSVPGRTMPAS